MKNLNKVKGMASRLEALVTQDRKRSDRKIRSGEKGSTIAPPSSSDCNQVISADDHNDLNCICEPNIEQAPNMNT